MANIYIDSKVKQRLDVAKRVFVGKTKLPQSYAIKLSYSDIISELLKEVNL